MRRTAAMLVGLVLMAGAVQAQKPMIVAKADSVGTATGRVAVADSVQYQVRWCARTTKGVGISASGHCTSKTLPWWIKAKPDTVKPPVPPDTTKPPTPPDTTKPPVPAGVLFASDWRSGDLLDGGKWTRSMYQSIMSVVPAAGHGFPSSLTNVVRVRMGVPIPSDPAHTSADWIIARGKWSAPKVGESRAYRIYFRSEVADFEPPNGGGWSGTHTIEGNGTDGSTSGGLFEILFGNHADGTFPWAFATPAGYPRNYFTVKGQTGATVGPLKKRVTYRYEWKLTSLGGTNYTLDIRITDDKGVIVGDKNTISAWGGPTLASNQTIPLTASDALTALRFGSNGGFNAPTPQDVFYGGFAVCTDWCGSVQ